MAHKNNRFFKNKTTNSSQWQATKVGYSKNKTTNHLNGKQQKPVILKKNIKIISMAGKNNNVQWTDIQIILRIVRDCFSLINSLLDEYQENYLYFGAALDSNKVQQVKSSMCGREGFLNFNILLRHKVIPALIVFLILKLNFYRTLSLIRLYILFNYISNLRAEFFCFFDGEFL